MFQGINPNDDKNMKKLPLETDTRGINTNDKIKIKGETEEEFKHDAEMKNH